MIPLATHAPDPHDRFDWQLPDFVGVTTGRHSQRGWAQCARLLAKHTYICTYRLGSIAHSRHPRSRIERTFAAPVHTEMQMWRCGPRVSGVADQAERVTDLNHGAVFYQLLVQVGVVEVVATLFVAYPHDTAAARRFAYSRNHARRDSKHG